MKQRTDERASGDGRIIEIPAFKVPAGQKPAKDAASASGATILRAWQRRGFDALRGQRRRILIAPTGSGKSTLVKALACDELTANPVLRVIVAVPQTMVARSFGPMCLLLGRRTIQWAAGHDLADDGPQTVRRLIEFLKAPPATELSGRILVCTHQTLVRAHQRLMAEMGSASSPWAGVSLYIDETHHSQADADDVTNRLGELVGHWLAVAPGPLTLITATWLRGNLAAIVPKDSMAEFARFTLGMDEFLETMEHLREVSFRFLIGDEFEALRHIYGEGNRKTLLWLPHVASRHVRGNGGKLATLDAYLGAVGDVVAKSAWTTTLRHRPARGKAVSVRALDLVTEEGREERKAKLYEAIPLGPKHTPDLLVALNLGKEGFDWPECARGVAMGERGSTPEVIQMLGRILRDCPGKTSVEFNIVLPYDGKERPDTEVVRAYIKTILASMVVEWQLTQSNKRRTRATAATTKEGAADVVMSDPGKASEVIGAVVDAAITDPSGTKAPDHIIRDAIQTAGAEVGSMAQQEDLVRHVRGIFSARTKAMLSAVGELPVDVDVREEVFGCIRILAARFGYKTIGELREAIGDRCAPAPLDVVRPRIQGLSAYDYDLKRRGWGDEFIASARFRDVYDQTYAQVRDGFRGDRKDVVHPPIEEVRGRIQGMSAGEYDNVRREWGREWPASWSFVNIYKMTYTDVRSGTTPSRVRERKVSISVDGISTTLTEAELQAVNERVNQINDDMGRSGSILRIRRIDYFRMLLREDLMQFTGIAAQSNNSGRSNRSRHLVPIGE